MTDEIRVVDLEYEERDLIYAEAKYGVAFRRAKVAPGQKVYRLIELWEKTGTTSLVTQVLNEDGSPRANVDVAFYWPDAEEQRPRAGDWYNRFVHGPTNVNGDVGPGMGPGAYHGEGEGGPHATWVRDPNIFSDICEKLGMLAGTNHDHLDQKFQLVVEGPGPSPGPGEKVLKFKERLEFSHDVNMLGVAIDDDYAVVNDARGDFRGLGIDEPPIHPIEWIHPITGERMALMEGCGNFNDDAGVIRRYTMRVRNLKTSGWLIGEVCGETFFSLESGVDLKRVIYVYELVEEKPDPEPPPPGDLDAKVKAMIEAIAGANREMAVINALLAAEMEKLAGE